MKKRLFLIFSIFFILSILFVPNANISYANEDYVYLGGNSAGFSLTTRGAYVLGVGEVIAKNGSISPAKDAGIMSGDIILTINENEVNTASDIEENIENYNIVDLTIKRDDEIIYKKVAPVKDLSGKKKLGLFIRDSINGIGTLTFIKNRKFASLGHPIVCDNGEILEIIDGRLYNCNITSIKKGIKNIPGELSGVFNKDKIVGKINKNKISGVYGEISDRYDLSKHKKILVGEAKMGKAKIVSTINGETPKEYNISIIKTDEGVADSKNFVVKITDKNLLEKTGGIVQGMSGSPIIQEGKIVGAITHVFINDPTRGYGISINNMLLENNQ